MHLKRQKTPKNWPVKRKGTTYVVRPNFNMVRGIPILIILRDLLGLAQNRKEVKKILHQRKVLLNNKPVVDEKNSVSLFDVITIVPSNKHYRVVLTEKGIFNAEEIKEDAAGKKISKIIGKKILKGKKTQLNLSDGRNFISDMKCNINDSVVIDLKKGKMERCLPLKEKMKAVVFAGKHSGKKGAVKKIDLKEKTAGIDAGKKEIHVLIKQIMITE